MASPFNIFRRNQRVMMAVLTGLSMIAFIFFDATLMRNGQSNRTLFILMIAAICALGLWFVGSPRGKGSEWALWGALLGGVAAFLFFRSGGPEPVARTKTASYSETDLQRLAQKRMKANRFVQLAAEATKSMRAQAFGSFDDRSMLQFALGEQEAKRLGISLNNEAVNRFIHDITENRLSGPEFKRILEEIPTSQGELFNILRKELEVRLALGLQMPSYDNWLDFDFRSGQRFYRQKLPATPDEQWQLFQRMNVKQSLSVVALPVEDFTSKVEEPSDSELLAFFEQFKRSPPGARGEPGFVQPHRVQLAYLAADFEKFESLATPATDEEVAEYYEKNKDLLYRVRDIPESGGADQPADASSPENSIPDLPAPGAGEAGAATPESNTENKPADQPVKEPEAKQPEPEKPAEKKDEPSSAVEPRREILVRPVSFVAQDQPQADKAEAEKPAAAESPAADDAAKAEQPKDEKPSATDDLIIPPEPGAEKEVRYQPLDDDLRLDIREKILRERTFEKMGEAIEQAQQYMETLAIKYAEASDAEKPGVAKSLAESLKTYAGEHGLEYVETKLLSDFEFRNSLEESIGTAVLGASGPTQFQARSVVEDLFPAGGSSGPLYFPQRADSRLRNRRYAYWKIQDAPQHVPSFGDEGIKDRVLGALKQLKARELAAKRAQELLELAKNSPNDLGAAFSGQTITGAADGEGVTIKETPRFSWLTTGFSTPGDPNLGDFMSPRLAFIEGVDQAGPDFMKIVFDDLAPGQVGIAENFPRNIFYLVQVNNRDGSVPPAEVEGFQTAEALRDLFLQEHSSDRSGFALRPYNLQMSQAFGQLQQQFMKSFDERYGVIIDEPDPEAAPASRRRR